MFRLLISQGPLLVFLVSVPLLLGAQNERVHKNAFLEFGGNGLLASANFDLRLKKGVQDGLGFRVGFGGIGLNATDDTGSSVRASLITVPLGLNYLIGPRKGSLELGLGATLINVSGDVEIDNEDFADGSGFGAIGFLNVGYRLQPLENGFMLRATWTPFFNSVGFTTGWLGLSLGFGFK